MEALGPAALINVSKFHRDLRSLGLTVSKNTLFEYLGYLEDAFLIFPLPLAAEALRRQAHNPKKVHVIDPGLRFPHSRQIPAEMLVASSKRPCSSKCADAVKISITMPTVVRIPELPLRLEG